MKIGAQLYSINVKCKTDEGIRETFKTMKEQGYQSVQMSGFDYDAEKVKAYADEFGMHIGLSHTPIPRIIEETDAVIRDHKIMGAEVVGVGYPTGYLENNIVDIERLMSDLAPAAKKIQEAGLGFAYHNHAMEFTTKDGKYDMDVLFEKTNWLFTLDTGWCNVAGADVFAAIKKYASRLKYVHLKDFREPREEDTKDSDRIVPLFHGKVPMAEIIEALKEVGTVEVAYVEQDNASQAEDPYGEMKESMEQLKARGYV